MAAPSVDDLARSFELLPHARRCVRARRGTVRGGDHDRSPTAAANGLRACQATAAQSCAWKAVSTGVPATLAAQLAMLV